jgi:hypothetical protein
MTLFSVGWKIDSWLVCADNFHEPDIVRYMLFLTLSFFLIPVRSVPFSCSWNDPFKFPKTYPNFSIYLLARFPGVLVSTNVHRVHSTSGSSEKFNTAFWSTFLPNKSAMYAVYVGYFVVPRTSLLSHERQFGAPTLTWCSQKAIFGKAKRSWSSPYLHIRYTTWAKRLSDDFFDIVWFIAREPHNALTIFCCMKWSLGYIESIYQV